MRAAFGAALVEAGERHADLFVLDADCATSTRSALFAERFPERFANVGIAEQNMVGVAAGLAQVGFRVIINSFAAMLTHRAHEQLMQSVGLMASPVLVVGHYAGLSAGEEGAPHHAISDIAVMRAVPGMEVWWPGDDERVKEMVRSLAGSFTGPTYLRLERNPSKRSAFAGTRRGLIEIWSGGDPATVCIIASGSVLARCLEAASGVRRVVVVGVDRVCPFPCAELRDVLADCKELICIEEHGSVGGLASALRESGVVGSRELTNVAIHGYTETGSTTALARRYGLDAESIRDVLLKAVDRAV